MTAFFFGKRMDGKICVIAAAPQGLRAAIASRLAASCAAGGGRGLTGTPAYFVRSYFGQVEECREVISKTDRPFGRIDVLVNAWALTDQGTIVTLRWAGLTRCSQSISKGRIS